MSEFEIKLRASVKDMQISVEEKLKRLDTMPKADSLVNKGEYSRFVENFWYYKDNVDRLTDVLLKGYKADADHLLKSKMSKVEAEDILK